MAFAFIQSRAGLVSADVNFGGFAVKYLMRFNVSFWEWEKIPRL